MPDPFSPTAILEGTTGSYSTTIKDEAGVAVPAAAFTAIRMTCKSLYSGAVINSRNNQNVLNTNNVTIDSNGLFTWTLVEADVIIVDSPKPSQVVHRATVVFEWDDGGGTARQHTREIDVTIQRATDAPFDAP